MISAMTAVVMASMVAQAGVESLVKAHEEGPGRIQTLRCTIDERMSVDGGETWTTMTTREVRRSGDRERVHMKTLFLYKNGDRFDEMKPVWHIDALFAPDGVRTMDGYDPEHPPREPITVANERDSGRRLGGMIRAPLPHGPWGYKGIPAAVFGGDFLLFFLPDARYSTRDLVEATKDVTPAERRDGAGNPLWDLPLKTPDGKSLITLTLDPRRGYAIVENKGTNIASGSVATRRVVDWHEPAPGIFVPKTIRIERPALAQLRHEFLVRDVAVNAPIPEAELAFRFPKGLGVGDEAKDVFYLWGDGKPERTFTTDEYNKWRREQMELSRFQ